MDERIDPVVFQLGTKEYKLVLTAPAIRIYEKTAVIGFSKSDIPANFTQTVTLLWAAASTYSPHLRLDSLFDYLSDRLWDLPRIAEALGECTKRAFRTGESEEGKAGEASPLDS